jgi:hypothetical protein
MVDVIVPVQRRLAVGTDILLVPYHLIICEFLSSPPVACVREVSGIVLCVMLPVRLSLKFGVAFRITNAPLIEVRRKLSFANSFYSLTVGPNLCFVSSSSAIAFSFLLAAVRSTYSQTGLSGLTISSFYCQLIPARSTAEGYYIDMLVLPALRHVECSGGWSWGRRGPRTAG